MLDLFVNRADHFLVVRQVAKAQLPRLALLGDLLVNLPDARGEVLQISITHAVLFPHGVGGYVLPVHAQFVHFLPCC